MVGLMGFLGVITVGDMAMRLVKVVVKRVCLLGERRMM